MSHGEGGGHGKHSKEGGSELDPTIIASMFTKTITRKEFFDNLVFALGAIFLDFVSNPVKGGKGGGGGGGGHHH